MIVRIFPTLIGRTRGRKEERVSGCCVSHVANERNDRPRRGKLCYCTLSQPPASPARRSPVVATSRRFPRRRREYSWTVRACRRSHPPGRHETSRRTEIRRRTSGAAARGDGISIEFSKRGWAREGGNFSAGIETHVNPDDASENVPSCQSSPWIVNEREGKASLVPQYGRVSSVMRTVNGRIMCFFFLFFSFRASAIRIFGFNPCAV